MYSVDQSAPEQTTFVHIRLSRTVLAVFVCSQSSSWGCLGWFLGAAGLVLCTAWGSSVNVGGVYQNNRIVKGSRPSVEERISKHIHLSHATATSQPPHEQPNCRTNCHCKGVIYAYKHETVSSNNTSRHCTLTVPASVVDNNLRGSTHLLRSCTYVLHDGYLPVHCSTVPHTSSWTVPYDVVSPLAKRGITTLPCCQQSQH